MPIRPEKVAAVAELKTKFSKAKSVVLADYRGLNVAQATKLRRKLRENGVEFKVVKNTLAAIAAQEAGIEGLDPLLVGPIAIAFSSDAVAPAKHLNDFAKENKQLDIKGGVLEGVVIDLAKVKALADLPSREVLLAQVVGGMQAPLYGLGFVLSATLRGFANAVDALRRQKEESDVAVIPE